MRKTWTNPKYPRMLFYGYYRKIDGDREFYLRRAGYKRQISFESPQAAKKAGWVAD